MMKVLQIANTFGQRCGVGNLAQHTEDALKRLGVNVQTSTELVTDAQSDVVLLHHEWGLFPDSSVIYQFCSSIKQSVIMFSHSPGTEKFAHMLAGFVTMCPGVVNQVGKPVFEFPHPAWVPGKLEDRMKMKTRYGLADKGIVIGSSGFLFHRREFPEILSRILPIASENNWFIDLVTSRWLHPILTIESQLDQLLRDYPLTFRYGKKFLNSKQLNMRLQACDLLWCWASTPSTPYASGVASDQYASGTRIVITDKQQHHHVSSLPNVVRAPTNLEDFVDALIVEAGKNHFPRHPPEPVSWKHWTSQLVGFLAQFC
jgi:hypothetical protein